MSEDGQIPPEAVARMEMIANALGKTQEQVLDEILKLGDDQYPFMGKLAAYQSLHKNELSGIKMRLHLIPLFVDQQRTVKRKDGSMVDVLDVIGLVDCNPQKPDEFEVKQISFWGPNNVLAAKGLTIDHLYSFDASVNVQTGRIGFAGKDFQDEAQDMDVDMKDSPAISPGEIGNHLDELLTVRGFVGKVINKDSSRGLELSDVSSNPQMCWLPKDYPVDDTWKFREAVVLGFGRVDEKTKELNFNGRRAFLL